MAPQKSKTKLYVILLAGLPVLFGVIFFSGALLLVSSLSEPSNPQDATGWLYLYAPVAAGIGVVGGLAVGAMASIAILFLDRSKKKRMP